MYIFILSPHTLSHTLFHTHTLIHSHILTHALTLMHIHTFSLTHLYSLKYSLTLAHLHIHTYILTHVLTLTHTPSHTHIHPIGSISLKNPITVVLGFLTSLWPCWHIGELCPLPHFPRRDEPHPFFSQLTLPGSLSQWWERKPMQPNLLFHQNHEPTVPLVSLPGLRRRHADF